MIPFVIITGKKPPYKLTRTFIIQLLTLYGELSINMV